MDRQNLRHVAIIMDGNGRCAQARGLPRLAGHCQGAAVVRKIVTHCQEAGLHFLTLYAFSTENWSRPILEVNGLMNLLGRFLEEQEDRLVKHAIELRWMRLTLTLSYSGRDEIVRTARRLARRVAEGTLRPDAIDEHLFGDSLDTGDTPPADLVIRTGSERRLSNFLLWQSAYAELFFSDCPWPDFSPEDFDQAVDWYHRRRRTFGLVEAVG